MTTQTLRPDNQVATIGTITRTPNVSANLNLDDSPADAASYVYGNSGGVRLYLGLGTYTLAAGERVRYVTPRLAIFHDSADVGWREYVHVRLWDPGLSKTTPPQQMGTVTNTPGITVTGAALAFGPGGQAWSQDLINRLQLDLGWLASGGGSFLRVYEAYVDLDVNSQPVVSGVTVTGHTTSTRPTVTFTFTDADLDPQTRLLVHVFSAEQYGAAGFDPETSLYTWSSGLLPTNATSVTVDQDLINGRTYKAYVKAAQDWPGPEGPLWWSDWAISSAFTLALTPPLTPSITAAAQTGVPEYRAKLDVTAPTNLLSLDEADFETSSPPANWPAEANCTVARSTTNPAYGVACMTLTATAGGNMSAQLSVAALKAVSGGVQYTAVAAFRAATTGRSCRVKLRWYDRTTLISTDTGSNVTDTTGGYTQATVTATAPANAVFVGVVVEVLSAGAAEVHRVDQVSVHRGSSTTWTQGGMSATLLVERMERVWADFRGPAKNWAHPQIASGGGLTRNTDGWYSRVAGLLSSVAIDTAPPTGADGAGQARMIVWRPTTGAGSFLDIGSTSATTTDLIRVHAAPAVVGLQTRVALWAKTLAGTFNARVVAYSTQNDNTVVTTANGSTVALSTTWQRLTVDITPGAGSVWLRAAVENTSAAVEVDVAVTGVRYCPTTVDDGSTPPGQGVYIPEWEAVRSVELTNAPGSPGETLRIYDHEVPPGRPMLYRVTTQGTVADQAVASAPSTPVTLLMNPPARAILKTAQPENAMAVRVAAGDQWDRSEDTQVFHPAGRDKDPVTVRDWLSGRDNSLTVHSLTDTELYRLEQLLPDTWVLWQWSEGGQTYAHVTGYSSTRVVRDRLHRLSVAYREMQRPDVAG